jgi:hypothetical protein
MLIYAAVATLHSVIAPLTVGNDEWAHFLYTRFIAEHGRLPINLAEREEAGYKSDAPPLYHVLVSTVTGGVEPTRLLRPIDSPRRQLADNIVDSYALVHTAVELPPYRGEVLLWHLGRVLSVLFGMAVIGLTYMTGLELFPGRRRALLAAAWLAFLPAFIFHSSVLSYESLSAMLTALFLLVSIKAISRPEQWRWWLALGAVAGLSISTKYSAALLPLEMIFVGWLAFRIRPAVSPLVLARCLLVAALMLILAVSWWFGFVVWHFNTVETKGPIAGLVQPLLVGDASDTTSVNMAAFLFDQETIRVEERPPLARDYGELFRSLLDSFWAAPVVGKYIASPWLSLLFSLFILVGLAGLGRSWRQSNPTRRTWLLLLLFHTLLIVPLLGLRLLFSFDPREAAQGRHLLLPAASAIPILLVWGWEQWSPKIGPIVVAGLLLWSVLGQIGWAAITYPPPIPVWSGGAPETVRISEPPRSETFAKTMRLIGFDWQPTAGAGSLEIALWWEALASMSEDYLVELTLSDSAGRVVSYDLSHPVQGRYPTRAWEPGDIIRDLHWLPLSGSMNGTYQVQLRLLTRDGQPLPDDHVAALGPLTIATMAQPDGDSCPVWYQGRPDHRNLFSQAYRVRSSFTVVSDDIPILTPLGDAPDPISPEPWVSVDRFHVFIAGPNWSDAYQLSTGATPCANIMVDVPAHQFTVPDIPNPLVVNFNAEVQLLGYELPTRRIQPGGRLPLTLYWQALDYMGADYRIFDNLLDREQRRWGGYDRRPRDGYSTLLWVPGEVIVDAFGVPVDPAAPPGIYVLDIGLYRETEGRASSLPLVVAGQVIDQNSIQLGPIKVGGPPPGVTLDTASPQVSLNQPFGNEITLLGYDLTNDQGQDISNLTSEASPDGGSHLNITLYWQADAPPRLDYTTFLHLRDPSNQTVAQQDGPPVGGRYPTSLWDRGEIIVDTISLALDDIPPGRYRPTLGLYNRTTGDRLLAPGRPDNEVVLEPVDIP